MNDAQRAAIKRRQVAAVQTDADEGRPPAAPAPPQRPLAEIAAEARPDVGPGIPVRFVRFLDKSFQVVGMQSGETIEAKAQPNGREHRIELVTIAGAGCFLITYIDPSRREVLFDIVERSSVKTWRLA
jgi:hypothetical protein